MRIVYFDCFSGVSGDMLLGGLAALGADLTLVQDQLNEFLPQKVALQVSPQLVNGIMGTDVSVIGEPSASYKHLPEILDILKQSSLTTAEINAASQVFSRLATAEAHIHGVSLEKIHFHELGAIDTLVDVIGFFLAIRQLSIDEFYCSPLPLARGFASMSHGVYPLPAPATTELLKGIPCYGVESDIELVTPTGAAIITTVCSDFGPFPAATPEKIGYGSGKKRRPDVPNLIRVISGQMTPTTHGEEIIGIIETAIDDMNPEYLSRLFELFFQIDGALDISVQNVLMKKNRAGFQIQCLVRPDTIPTFVEFLLEETSTLGVRHRQEKRTIRPRHLQQITTRWGPAIIKVWKDRDGSVRFTPEYDSCRSLAETAKVSLPRVYEEVWL
ncbi:MAG: nickel pincer cofactor biosynthesis protein LarC, partial [Syntrophomonadaceae bacterium]|nr:nickel pincer cofactor biosynthesis protein LarC [Syntrophomonadaceae bacterium]